MLSFDRKGQKGLPIRDLADKRAKAENVILLVFYFMITVGRLFLLPTD